MRDERPIWRDPVLGAIVAASLALKLVLAWLAADLAPVNDEHAYLRLARALLAGEGHTASFRPPLYPAFLAGGLALFGSEAAVRVAQAVLSAACVPLVYALGRRAAGRRTARAAAAIFAFDPVLVGFSHLLWSETLFIALLLGGTWLVVRGAELFRPGDWAAAGVCFGLAGLARPQLLSFLPLLVPWTFAWARARTLGVREASIGFAALALATSAVVLPWTLRNWQALGSVVLVDTNGPYNFLVGTEPGAYRVDKDDRWSGAWARVGGLHYARAVEQNAGAVQRRALERAGRNIAADPGRFLAKTWWEAGHLWTLDNFVLRHLRNGWYPGVAPEWIPPLTIWMAGFSALLLAGGAIGIIALPASPLRGFAWIALAHATLLFGLTYSLSRYSAPLRPLLAIGAGFALMQAGGLRERLTSGSGARARQIACAAAVLFLLIAWARDLPLLADLVANGGAAFRFVAGP